VGPETQIQTKQKSSAPTSPPDLGGILAFPLYPRQVSDGLIAPHGGELVSLLVDRDRAGQLKEASLDWPSVDLTARQLCDLE